MNEELGINNIEVNDRVVLVEKQRYHSFMILNTHCSTRRIKFLLIKNIYILSILKNIHVLYQKAFLPTIQKVFQLSCTHKSFSLVILYQNPPFKCFLNHFWYTNTRSLYLVYIGNSHHTPLRLKHHYDIIYYKMY